MTLTGCTSEQAVAVEAELTEDYYRQVDQYLDTAAAALHEDTEDARLHLMLLWVQLSRFCFLWRVRGIELDEERTMTRLTQIWHDALSAPPVTGRRYPRYLPIV
jgi:hypothetical protein